MQMPKALNQAEIDEITAAYKKKIEENPEMETLYRIECESDIAAAIARKRQQAIEAGGELGERIKAENELMIQKMNARLMQPDMQEAMELARKREAELKEITEKDASLLQKASSKHLFCNYCGTKISEGAAFCTACGAKV